MIILASIFHMLFSGSVNAAELSVGQKAPLFTLKNQAGKVFSLDSRKGHWTVLYFYPKSETPGCTKQACTFRDSIGKIRELDADVFGVSVNSVEDQLKFKEHHKLNFELLADEDGKVTSLYGAKMPVMNIAKRWTFLIDPDLNIRFIDHDVDPVKDAGKMAEKLKEFQKKP